MPSATAYKKLLAWNHSVQRTHISEARCGAPDFAAMLTLDYFITLVPACASLVLYRYLIPGL